MTFAFVADIHANLPALRAALALADEIRVDRLIVAGDILGDGPHPAETVDLLRERAAYAIRGNVDREVLGAGRHDRELEAVLSNGAPPRQRNRAWTALQLDARQRKWLNSLAERSVFHVGRHTVMVVHGSPAGDTDYIYPSITEAGLVSKLGEAPRPDVLVCGHSHVPFVKRLGPTLVINTGSVGRPVDGDPRGALAVVDFVQDEVMATILRFEYDTAGAREAALDRDVPGVDADIYRQGVAT